MLGIFLSTHFVLTCTSTGGPATNVTWTRGSDEDNLVPVSENTSVSVLVNATTAQYIHTMNVSGTKLPAVYGCTVSNNKPSSAKVLVTIGIYNSMKYIMVTNAGLRFIISLQVPQIQRKSLCPVVYPAL